MRNTRLRIAIMWAIAMTLISSVSLIILGIWTDERFAATGGALSIPAIALVALLILIE